jgi:hypothetical protein
MERKQSNQSSPINRQLYTNEHSRYTESELVPLDSIRLIGDITERTTIITLPSLLYSLVCYSAALTGSSVMARPATIQKREFSVEEITSVLSDIVVGPLNSLT